MAGARQVGVIVWSHTGASFIDLTVAVVIKAVAFAGWTAVFSWRHPVGWQIGDAKTKGIANAIINQTIAIRVDVVALFSFRADFAFACLAPCTIDAPLDAGLAANLGSLQFGWVAMT